MYHAIRRIHLFAGLLLLLFVVMYFATGYVMIHNQWFGGNKPTVTTRTETLNYTGEKLDAALSLYLQQTFDLAGKRSVVNRRANGSQQFNFIHPGTLFEAVVAPDGKQVTITRRDMNFVGVANALHRINGYGGGTFYLLWALVFDLASAAMILFAVSGVYLWYKSTPARLPGWVCLVAGSGYTAAMTLFLLYAK